MARATLSRRDIQRARKRALRLVGPQQTPQYDRPQRRGDCAQGMRPCPFVACRHHIFLDAKRNGSIKLPHGDDPEVLRRLPYTCSLDAAEEGPLTLDQVAVLLGLTRERVRQVEEMAKRHFAHACSWEMDTEDWDALAEALRPPPSH